MYSDSARHDFRTFSPYMISQIVLKNLIKISLIIKDKKECPEEILIKLAMKISKSS
jgi:hypothetical protein